MNKYEIIVAHGGNTETIVADYFEIDSDGVKFFKYTDDTKLESECVAAYIIPGEALKVIKRDQ